MFPVGMKIKNVSNHNLVCNAEKFHIKFNPYTLLGN